MKTSDGRRYTAFRSIRHVCDCCEGKKECFVIKVHSPKKRTIRVCHECFIEFADAEFKLDVDCSDEALSLLNLGSLSEEPNPLPINIKSQETKDGDKPILSEVLVTDETETPVDVEEDDDSGNGDGEDDAADDSIAEEEDSEEDRTEPGRTDGEQA